MNDIMEALPKLEEDNIDEFESYKINLKYPTNHLNGFNELKEASHLYGEEYTLILKALWYGIISLKNGEVELKLGQLRTDGRIHLLIPLRSGKGKKELKRLIKAVLGDGVKEPTSLHPEQLVGKTKIRNKGGNTSSENILGFFSQKYLIIDEGRTLLTSRELNYTESRRYLRLALDPYPNNQIEKKSVETSFEDALKYTPYMGCCIFTQPYFMEEDFATDGDLRRFIVPYVKMGGIDRLEAYKNRILDTTDTEESESKFKDFVDNLPDFKHYTISELVYAEFVHCSMMLIERGFNHKSKIRNFVDLYDFTIQDMLLKLCHVQALQEGTNEISVKHVDLAFIDLFEFLEHLYLFVDTKIFGNIDYGEKWDGATKKDKEILQWLKNQGANSLETSKTSIKSYVKKIMDIFEVQDRQAKRIKQNHEEKGWIKSKQDGPHDSKVWLGFKPKINDVNSIQPQKFEDFYLEKIEKNVPEDMSPLTPLKDNVNDIEDLKSNALNSENPGALEASEQLAQEKFKQEKVSYSDLNDKKLGELCKVHDMKALAEVKRRNKEKVINGH